jgi:hypothetical protein
MNKNLLFVLSFLLICCGAFAQINEPKKTSNIFSNSPIVKEDGGAKKVAVKLYPNPSYGKITVSTNTNNVLHFYIFDLEGTLVYQTVLKNKERKTIENLKKGTYLYDVFENDESIEEGKIIVK